MKSWNIHTKNKQELTTDLMFKEIIKLRTECAGLSTHLWELITAIEDSEEKTINPYVKEKLKEAKEYRKSM